jgi:predicted nucleotidyltransferase
MMAATIPVESFFDLVQAQNIWPKEIANSADFIAQIQRRKELCNRLEDVASCLPRPDMPLEKAINQDYVSAKQAAELYTYLSDLLEFCDDYRRIVLYLPFELLPSASWHPLETNLWQSTRRFRRTYMNAWKKLLSVHDVRANFVDGDVIEIEQRESDLPRVVKAAHLIPILIGKGMIKYTDAIRLMKEADDPLLRNGILDILPVLVASKSTAAKSAMHQNQMKAIDKITYDEIKNRLADEFAKIDLQTLGDITEKRKKWLKLSQRKRAIDNLGKVLSGAISNNNLLDTVLASFLQAEAESFTQQVLVVGIREAIEFEATTSPTEAKALYKRYKECLLTFWRTKNESLKEELIKTFRHLRQLDIISEEQLIKLGINSPVLAGPFTKNLELIASEVRDAQRIATLIKTSAELSETICPVIMLFGSRIKGYGAQNADIDIGVFVKPDVDFEDRPKLHKLITDLFGQDGIVEFWLEEKEDRLWVRNFPATDVNLGESYWTHVLFGAAWTGDDDTIRELFARLLVPYLYGAGERIHGCNARRIYLEEMERDTLLYRLMHKGYEQFFPRFGGDEDYANRVDGESMFWDSGYRWLATRLFVNRVFLPIIPAP